MPPEHEPQLEPVPEDASCGPLDCTAKALKSFVTLSLLQDGHSTASSFDLSSTSKSERHFVQVYSYMGIGVFSMYKFDAVSLLCQIYRDTDEKEIGENVCFHRVKHINVNCSL